MTRAVCAREGKPGAEAGMGGGLGEQTIPTERTLGKLSYNWSGSVQPVDKGLPRLPTRAVVITDQSDHQESSISTALLWWIKSPTYIRSHIHDTYNIRQAGDIDCLCTVMESCWTSNASYIMPPLL